MAANAVASRRQRRLGGQGVAALAFLAMHAALLAWGGWTHSPTYEETGHLPAGLYGWARGRFDADVADPPLIPLVAAMPVALASAEMDWYTPALDPRRREAFFFGDALLRANGERTFWFYTLARWACIPFSLLGGIVCFLWAKDMFGPSAGLLALGLWCFCPNILGHGHLIGADLGGRP